MLRELCFILLAATAVNSHAAPIVSINPSVKFQKIDGLMAASNAGQDKTDYASWQHQLLDSAVNDLGLTRLRLGIRSGSENVRDFFSEYTICNMNGGQNCLSTAEERCLRYSTVNDNSDPFSINWAGFKFTQLDHVVTNVVLPVKQKLQARGEKLYLDLTYVGTNQYSEDGCALGLKNDHIDTPEEYAEFILATSLYLRNTYGLVPDIWEFALEPEHVDFVVGNRPADLMGRALLAAGNRLKANGFNPKFGFPTASYAENVPKWFDDAISVPGVLNYLEEIIYQRYGDNRTANLQAIASRAVQYGLQTGMSEYNNGSVIDLHTDLKDGRVSFWQQFIIGLGGTNPAGRGVYYHIDMANNYNVVMHDETKNFRQYFRYVRPGAQRIEATSTNGNFDPLAFINANGSHVVVIRVINTGGSISVGNLANGNYGVTYTTSPQNSLISQPDVVVSSGSPVLNTSIPAAGIITIYQKSGFAGPSPTPDLLAPAPPSALQSH